jgi:hypothetical protein
VLGRALPIRFSLSAEPDDTVEQVRAKERALASLAHRDSALSKWKRIADLWCARWFSTTALPTNAFLALCDRILTGESELPDPLADACLHVAGEAALAHRFFHWELEFPEAFFDRTGRPMVQAGFDAVIGNPPWDMIRADVGPTEERSDRRRETSATLRFTRETGIYTAQSRGHGNRYQLFVERAGALTKPGGRIGLVLPSGFATDHGNASLRRLLFADFDVDAIVGFENRLAVFPIHRSTRFLLLTATRGGPTGEIRCRLGEADPSVLDTVDDDNGFPVRVTTRLLTHLSGEDVALPDLRSPIDVAIAERAAALFRPLADENGWNVRFGRELNATEDRGVFQRRGRGLPVVEGKQIEPFRAQAGKSRWSIAPADASRLLGRRHQAARLAYRDVASPTNKLTFIAAVLPAGCVSTHTLFCLRSPLPLRHQMFLCGLFNSLLVNYLVRLRVTTHVTTAVVERLPIPSLEHAPSISSRIAALARLLSRREHPVAFASLNALVAELYRVTEEEFRHVLSTFPLIPSEQREAAMQRYGARSR